MQINPIETLNPISDLTKIDKTSEQFNSNASTLPFQSLFEDAVNNVKSTNADVNQEIYKLATGQSDDLHNVVIASQKATMSVQMLVQLRDKVLESYNEVMRMSV
jgi:flagellar hook-basal body complex protein FliE